jgi:hypothetical protein
MHAQTTRLRGKYLRMFMDDSYVSIFLHAHCTLLAEILSKLFSLLAVFLMKEHDILTIRG